jgi:hypothetical protein
VALRRDIGSYCEEEFVAAPVSSSDRALGELVKRGLCDPDAQAGVVLGVLSTIALGVFGGALELTNAAALYRGNLQLECVPQITSRDLYWAHHAELRTACFELEAEFHRKGAQDASRALDSTRAAVLEALMEWAP